MLIFAKLIFAPHADLPARATSWSWTSCLSWCSEWPSPALREARTSNKKSWYLPSHFHYKSHRKAHRPPALLADGHSNESSCRPAGAPLLLYSLIFTMVIMMIKDNGQ